MDVKNYRILPETQSNSTTLWILTKEEWQKFCILQRPTLQLATLLKNKILLSNKYLRVDFGLFVTAERLSDLGNRL